MLVYLFYILPVILLLSIGVTGYLIYRVKKDNKLLETNNNDGLKTTEELVDLDEDILMDILNDSYRLENTFDGKERYYALHYLLSHPEMEFNREVTKNIYKASINTISGLKLVSHGKIFDTNENSFMTKVDLDYLLVSMYYEDKGGGKQELEVKDNILLHNFRELLDTDLEDLPKLEDSKYEISLENVNKFSHYSLLGTKVLVVLIQLDYANLVMAIVDEKENVYGKRVEINKDKKNIYYPLNFFINNDEIKFMEKNKYDIDTKNSVVYFDGELNNEALDSKILKVYYEKEETKKVPFNTEGLLYEIDGDDELEISDVLFDYKVNRHPDSKHWSNLIETNYMMNKKEKKQFIKKLHSRLVEERKMNYIEEYKEYQGGE